MAMTNGAIVVACLYMCLSYVGLVAAGGPLSKCPGESARYGDHKCNHDATHRVCAKLLDTDGTPKRWGAGDFWEITHQKAFQWDTQIRANNGDSWCICMWATARLIEQVGCGNVHIRCDATDIDFVLKRYDDMGVTGRVHDLRPAHECIKKKCQSTLAVEANASGNVVEHVV